MHLVHAVVDVVRRETRYVYEFIKIERVTVVASVRTVLVSYQLLSRILVMFLIRPDAHPQLSVCVVRISVRIAFFRRHAVLLFQIVQPLRARDVVVAIR